MSIGMDINQMPTPTQAFWAAKTTVGNIAEAFDSKFVVAPCRQKTDDVTRVCRARIEGHLKMRLRVFVTLNSNGEYLIVRVRAI